MERNEMLKQLDKMKSKLMAAVAMLLISALLMSSTSYAWFVLSTAPEIAKLNTTAGANGALEIALPGTITQENGLKRPDEPKSKVGASSANIMQPVEEANTYWGNMVEITESYGLQNLVLFPSRLNLSSTLVNTVELASPLLVPTYGTDGRISSTASVGSAVYNKAEDQYNTSTDYGVHLLGFFADGESSTEDETIVYSRQDIIDQMAVNIQDAHAGLRNDIVSMVNRHSGDIIQLLVEIKFKSDPSSRMNLFRISSLSSESVTAMGEMIQELGAIADGAMDSLRYAVMAKAAADLTHYPDTDEGKRELGRVYAGLSQMSTDTMTTLAGYYPDILASIQAVTAVKNRISEADRLLREATDKMMAATALFDIACTELGGYTNAGIFTALDIMAADSNHTADMYMWANSVGVGDSSPFAALAKIVGDYNAEISDYVDYQCVMVKSGLVVLDSHYDEDTGATTNYYMTADGGSTTNVDEAITYDQLYAAQLTPMAGTYKIHMYVTGGTAKAYDEEANAGELASIYASVSGLTTEGEFTVSNLVTDLKTAYGYSVDFAVKTSSAGELLLQQEAIDRVTGETAENGTPSTTMGSGSVIRISNTASDIADLNGLLQSIYVVFYDTINGQIYGVATVDTDRMRTETGDVQVAPLVLRYANITDGKLTAGIARDSLLTMSADTTYYITALTYVNGDMVDGSMISATQGASLNGKINLQFANSTALYPMEYSGFAS